MKIVPLGKFIYVKVNKVTESGGIALPDIATEEEEIVEVLAIGDEVTSVVVGDKIYCVPGSGMHAGSKDHVFVRETDVIAIVRDSDGVQVEG